MANSAAAAERELILKLADRHGLKFAKPKDENLSEEEARSKADAIRQRYELFVEDGNQFQTGDLVVWKTGLKNRKKPSYNEPVVVLAVEWDDAKAQASTDETDTGSPYFGEPLTVQLGMLDEDGDFLTYFFDRRRFRKFE